MCQNLIIVIYGIVSWFLFSDLFDFSISFDLQFITLPFFFTEFTSFFLFHWQLLFVFMSVKVESAKTNNIQQMPTICWQKNPILTSINIKNKRKNHFFFSCNIPIDQIVSNLRHCWQFYNIKRDRVVYTLHFFLDYMI